MDDVRLPPQTDINVLASHVTIDNTRDEYCGDGEAKGDLRECLVCRSECWRCHQRPSIIVYNGRYKHVEHNRDALL